MASAHIGRHATCMYCGMMLLLFSRLLDELAEKNETDAKSQETQMRVFQKEKKEFVTRLTGIYDVIKIWHT